MIFSVNKKLDSFPSSSVHSLAIKMITFLAVTWIVMLIIVMYWMIILMITAMMMIMT